MRRSARTLAGAAAGVLGTVSGALKELPEIALYLLIGGGVLGGLMALGVYLYRQKVVTA